MKKVIVLSPLELTDKKQKLLDKYRIEALGVLHDKIIPVLDLVENYGELQKKVYHQIRTSSTLHSQVVLNLIRCSMALKDKSPENRNVNYVTLDCNIPRAGKVFHLKSGTFCVKLNLAKKTSVAVAIKKNRMLTRLEDHLKTGWKMKQIGISTKNKILIVVEKRKVHVPVKNFLGVDINSNNVAVTVIDPKGKVLMQTYLGQGMWKTKSKILLRKSKLQRLVNATKSARARTSLGRLRHKLRNFTRNSAGELSKEIHDIAKDYTAKIVLEKLEKFTANKGRKANKQISLLPFALIKERIISRSIDTGIPLSYVDPYHTSKWCPRCGSVNPPHNSKIYAIYRCSKCGLVVNSDRKASYVIALKKLVERKFHSDHLKNFQISKREVDVNQLFRRYENGCENQQAVPAASHSTKAPSLGTG